MQLSRRLLRHLKRPDSAGNKNDDDDDLSLVLVVDKEANRVLWAESGGDVVDVLFSFLTLPLGTAVRVLGKQTGLGSVDELYKSAEALDERCFQTPSCKNMLLRPRSAAERLYKDLPAKVDDGDLDFYTCWDRICIPMKPCLYSPVRGAQCRCLGAMDGTIKWGWKSTEAAVRRRSVHRPRRQLLHIRRLVHLSIVGV